MSVLVIGGGGHAKVVISTLRASGVEIEAVLDEDATKWGTSLLGVPVVNPYDGGISSRQAIIAIGSNDIRKRIAEEFDYEWVTATHPSAIVDDSVSIGVGTVVFANAVIQPDTVIGAHVIVNTAATIDHDCVIGDFAHIAPGVHFSGGVQVGEGALVGVGSSVIPGKKIGQWAIVGGGSAVVKDVSAHFKVAGAPARPL